MNFYAKFESDGSYLPLKTHLKDTALCAAYLYEHWVPPATKNFLCTSLNISDTELKKLYVLLAYIHDVGKATPVFQLKAWDMLDSPEKYLSCLPPNPTSGQVKFLHHSTTGAFILKKLGLDKGNTTIVGSHHGRWRASMKESLYFMKYKNYLNGTTTESFELFTAYRKETFEEGLLHSELSMANVPVPKLADQILLTGLLNMADWLASDAHFFPLYSEGEKILKDEERFLQAKKDFQITEPWQSMHYLSDESDFEEVFSFPPRPFQKDVIEMLSKIEKSGLLVLEAPMGCGKTEIALYAAQKFAFDHGQGGLFYGLPTVATSNGILGRIMKWADAEVVNGKLSLQLVHGKTMFNEPYQNFRNKEFDQEDLVVSRWMEKNKLQLCPNFVIGTIDHLLRSVLKRNHFMLDHLGMAGKVVILDEIHSYDAYTLEYLYRCLEWLGFYKVPVILLSATLAPSFRKKLAQAYLHGANPASNQDFSICDHQQYPVMTFVSEDGIQTRSSDPGPSKQVTLQQLKDWSGIKNSVANQLAAGGCVGILVNTIRQAQSLYQELKSLEKEGFTVKLLHSGFTDADRAEKESELLDLLGKPKSENDLESYKKREKLIVIGTQVFEQSLDIDFDWLVTEICPIDLLFQRIGRLHRHLRKRPSGLQTPECWVVGKTCEELNSGTRAIYFDWILEKTLQVLQGRNHLMVPGDISSMIAAVYENSDISSISEEQAKNEYQLHKDTKISKAQAFLLADPISDEDTMRNLLTMQVDAQDAEQAVRDCGLSVEVILVSIQDQEYALTSDEKRISRLETPDFQTAKNLLRSKIKLPNAMVKRYALTSILGELENDTQALFPQWLKSKQISGELILALDSFWKGSLGDWQVEYSRETGLVVWKGDQNDESKLSG